MPRKKNTGVKALVKRVLDSCPAARDCDRELVYRVFVECGFDYPHDRFMALPNADYLLRLRREFVSTGFRRERLRGRAGSASENVSWLGRLDPRRLFR